MKTSSLASSLGYFEILPKDVLSLIFEQLNFRRLMRLGLTSKEMTRMIQKLSKDKGELIFLLAKLIDKLDNKKLLPIKGHQNYLKKMEESLLWKVEEMNYYSSIPDSIKGSFEKLLKKFHREIDIIHSFYKWSGGHCHFFGKKEKLSQQKSKAKKKLIKEIKFTMV